jgi:hypothetical protein
MGSKPRCTHGRKLVCTVGTGVLGGTDIIRGLGKH